MLFASSELTKHRSALPLCVLTNFSFFLQVQAGAGVKGIKAEHGVNQVLLLDTLSVIGSGNTSDEAWQQSRVGIAFARSSLGRVILRPA